MEHKCSKSKCAPLFPSHSLSCCLWDFAPICLRGSAARSYGSAFIQTSECLCGTAGCPRLVKNKPKMCDLWLPWWRGGERGGRTEVTGLHEGAKMQLTLLTGALSDGLMFVHHLPPTAALSLCVLRLLLACRAKTAKLSNIQVPTCPNSSLTGFIWQLSKPTPYVPFMELLWDSEGQMWGLKHHLPLKTDL